MKPDYIENIEKDDYTTNVNDKLNRELNNAPYHILIEGWTNSSFDELSLSEEIKKESEDFYCSLFDKKMESPLFVFELAFQGIKTDRIECTMESIFKKVFRKTKASYINVSIFYQQDKENKENKRKYTIFNQIQACRQDDDIRLKADIISNSIKKVTKEINSSEGFEHVCNSIVEKRSEYEKKHVFNKAFLNIIKSNSSIEISQDIIDFMESIVRKGRIKFLTVYDKLLPYHSDDPLPIPIYLKKPEDMPTYKELWKEVKGADKEKYIPNTIVLGYYCKGNNECNEPHIVLCPENIEGCTDDKTPTPVLYTIVLVHEYAHALLDKHFEFSLYHDYFENWDMDDDMNLTNSLSAKAMEESLANMIVLKWLKSFDDSKFEQAKTFIENKQPAIYQFGIHQYEADVDWKKWRESTKQNSQKLEDWFNYCFSNGKIKIPIEDYTKEIYDSVFE